MRLGGATLARTRAALGISAPTIAAAVRAFESGGWTAVDVAPRGRPRLDQARPDELAERLREAATLRSGTREPCWDIERTQDWFAAEGVPVSRSTVIARLAEWRLTPPSRHRRIGAAVPGYAVFARRARRGGATVLWLGERRLEDGRRQLFAHDPRGRAWWCLLPSAPGAGDHARFLDGVRRCLGTSIALVLPGPHLAREPAMAALLASGSVRCLIASDPRDTSLPSDRGPTDSTPYPFPNQPPARAEDLPLTPTTHAAAETLPDEAPQEATTRPTAVPPIAARTDATPMTHLERLEAESIHIMREVLAEADNPVMLYSIGKDSAVMLHLARKAFFPASLPFPLLHVDTTWKFRAMYEFRDRLAKEYGFELLTHVNPDGLAQGVNPFTHGSALHTDIMKTEGLKQALDKHRFDVAFGGARRDEEKSRAKERVFSFRSAQHRWEPKAQRPELWNLYNARKRPGESIRVFPISNWTELDVWQYIHRENIPIVPLYLAAERPVVTRDGTLIMVDDERMPLHAGEVPEMRKVRFRTLGCYPLTGAVESEADTLTDVIREMLLTKTSERQGRMIDHDSAASMEKKKQEGYF